MEQLTYTHGRAARFFVPLLLQALSQSLTYPLVGSITSSGPDGVDALTAFSLGLTIMFVIGAFGGGLITTGLVLAKTRGGMASFKRLNATMMAVLLSVQALVCIHPIDAFIFREILNLPPHLADIARRTTLFATVMQGGFFLRNIPLVYLFNAYASDKASIATLARVALTLGFAVVFPRMGLAGPDWGLVALTVPTLFELALSWMFAAKYMDTLEDGAGASVAEQFLFTVPLAIGCCLLAVSPFMIAVFVGRVPHSTDMLAIHYVTLGIVNPVSFAALRMQTVAIKFPPEWNGDIRLLKFAVAAGAVLGLVPLLFSLPDIGNWYYGKCQNIPPGLLSVTRLASFLYFLICIIHAIRGRVEGLAALAKRPRAVMSGQISYFVALVATLAILMPFGVPGWAMALSSIYAAAIAAAAATYAHLAFVRRKRITGPR